MSCAVGWGAVGGPREAVRKLVVDLAEGRFDRTALTAAVEAVRDEHALSWATLALALQTELARSFAARRAPLWRQLEQACPPLQQAHFEWRQPQERG